MSEPKKIDLAARKTEAGWIETADQFWLGGVPEMFKWIGWTAALAGLIYVGRKAEAPFIMGVVAAASIGMFFYLQAFFMRFEFVNFPFVKNPTVQRILSLALSFALAYGIYQLATYAAGVIAAAR